MNITAMKATVTAALSLCLLFALSLTSCMVVSTRRSVPPPVAHKHNGKQLPPGQAKKVYGTQSAKPFAPGQQKKKK